MKHKDLVFACDTYVYTYGVTVWGVPLWFVPWDSIHQCILSPGQNSLVNSVPLGRYSLVNTVPPYACGTWHM